ncbi:bacillithiol biosynthesis deacetylase BshB1 [Marivirga tractuosa]|uniref:LmbE family protein n=1 Tax=Marivirga tractuosa (strain ATCC 23168 / DSM 4126 / NBRC 15989 / NCIMB 1408 / VKM B-1430 / H-43) TaxID=643867 RepID=E4TL91_MARTH|nr:bacillithiol biosynthesis deacetylase BshB1 [Marivirga tractuosa]ADR20229.1 LmbE family protein [Marivirga tractuosa DSM 4126]BDD15330.1 bacillithiol biosynthesis deacetylase BshB1 [Marivirga tractuosa]
MKLNILAFAAHPDDIELSCAGTLAKHAEMGENVGIIDLTEGEMGTRGTPKIRLEEAAASADVLGLKIRENLGFEDAFFKNDLPHQKEIVKKIRQYQPDIILANAVSDRHPDHARASELISESVFLAGLKKFETVDDNGKAQTAYRPSKVYHYIQSLPIIPDFVVDVSDQWQKKMKSIKAFDSQFYKQDSNEPETYISSPRFMKMIEARAMEFGQIIGVDYAEGFTVERYLGVKDLNGLI